MHRAKTHIIKQRQFFEKLFFLTQPLPHSHKFVAWVNKKTLEVDVIRSAQTWKKVSAWLEKGE
jgi:hypothetical protein